MRDRDALSPTTEPSSHDRLARAVGRRTWQRRSDSALGMHTTKSGHAHDTDVRATKVLCRDRDSLSQHTCPVAKRKKIDPRDLGRHSLVSELQ